MHWVRSFDVLKSQRCAVYHRTRPLRVGALEGGVACPARDTPTMCEPSQRRRIEEDSRVLGM